MGTGALPEVREGLGVLAGSPGKVGRPYRMTGNGQKPSWKSGKCREALPEVWDGMRGPTRSPGRFGTPSQKSGKGREPLPEVYEGSGGPPG